MKIINTIKEIVAKAKNSATYRRNLILVIIGIIIISVGGIWLYGLRYVTTDDAYINANVIEIAPRISGQVNKLNIQNNQFVKKGTILFVIDPVPYQVAVAKAKAQLAINEAQWQNTATNAKRVLQLVVAKALPIQSRDDINAKLQTTRAAVELAKAALAQAELNLQYTEVVAAADGWVTNMSLRAGNEVTANQPLFALVSNAEYWVDANLKETELTDVKPQQKAKVYLDMYPHHTFHGVVESISKGSGAAFSLLPPQNAVGNWVKVAQRVPVKIRILDQDSNFPLRVGTTASVKIDTH